jgi:GntR family transcriptional regulator, transcriptional repressor for pyruvate dehydrogenase complex
VTEARNERQERRQPTTGLPGIVPIKLSRVSDEVAEQVRRLIISEDVQEGTRLPAERELAERFGASRPMVSQALRTLSLMGLVEIRRGSGAYVVRRPETMVTASVNLMLDLDAESLTHLVELRLRLEMLGAELACERQPALSDGEAETIITALDRLTAAAGKPSEWITEDTIFHAAIVRSSGNVYLAAIYESVHTAVLEYEFQMWVETDSVPEWLRNSEPDEQIALHAPIAAAVIAGDVKAARAAVLKHHEAMRFHLGLDKPTTPAAAPKKSAAHRVRTRS